MIDWVNTVVSLVSGVIGAAFGGFIVHRFTLSREINSARRSNRTDYLISAYRKLSDAANREAGLSEEQRNGLESALADVMLLGELEEVEATRLFMIEMSENSEGKLDSIIQALRKSLRRELKLSDIEIPQLYFRLSSSEYRRGYSQPLDRNPY